MSRESGLLSLRQAADLLGTCPAVVRSLVRRGELSVVRLPSAPSGKMRFSPAAIEGFIAEHQRYRTRGGETK